MHKAKFLFLIFCITLHFNSSYSAFEEKGLIGIKKYALSESDNGSCKEIYQHDDRQWKCAYAKSHLGCQPKGYIPYLQLFYCRFSPILGYVLLISWLLLLFYLLGDTASSYFCVSLEGLSATLKLSPTIAGVTLLSLGNGAPDVLDSIVSFMGDGNTSDIGLNSILGGVFFVTSVVFGVISIVVSSHGRNINFSRNFTWNIIILLLYLCCLLVIIIVGRINLWGSLGFLSLYLLYVAFVFASEAYASREERMTELPFDTVTVLPVTRSLDGSTDLHVPLLGFAADELENDQKGRLQKSGKDEKRMMTARVNLEFLTSCWFRKLIFILGLPLDLPRKLTIPLTSEEKWSRPFGVVSTLLAPIFLATIWNCHYPKPKLQPYIIGASFGVASSLWLFCITDSSNPPRKYKSIWLSESFLMSITWTYIFAQELVSLMVCLGIILGISNSVMGLTILAWGNSLGDLFSNVTLAKHGGPGGTQIAISGCYAGPIFNIVVGLGLSLAFATWAVYPSSLGIISDPSIYESFGFLMLGLLWALLVATKRHVVLDKSLGYVLLVIYFSFLILKMARTLGLLEDSF